MASPAWFLSCCPKASSTSPGVCKNRNTTQAVFYGFLKLPVYCSICCCMLLPLSWVLRIPDLLSNKYQVISGKLYNCQLMPLPFSSLSLRQSFPLCPSLKITPAIQTLVSKKDKCLKKLPQTCWGVWKCLSVYYFYFLVMLNWITIFC